MPEIARRDQPTEVTPAEKRALLKLWPVLYSTTEAAEYLGLTPGRIRQLLGEEAFPNAKRKPGGWLIPKPDLVTHYQRQQDKY